MAGNNVTTTGIVSKSGTLVVDSVPETSNSDISGSVNPFEDTKTSVKWCGDLNDWIQLILQSPLLIGVIAGFAVALVLILATTCVIVSICRLVLFKIFNLFVFKKFVKLQLGQWILNLPSIQYVFLSFTLHTCNCLKVCKDVFHRSRITHSCKNPLLKLKKILYFLKETEYKYCDFWKISEVVFLAFLFSKNKNASSKNIVSVQTCAKLTQIIVYLFRILL